ncbi:MAG: DUF2795 domain-containing protein [Candidatus Kerfeldbacteria bacterium]|nr:DUF2795 domain-containing protein [Candidatus Kerfeldbacteria bacterium]
MDDMKEMMDHLKSHMTYPASKQDIWNACNQMSHVPEEHKKMFMDKVPEGTYHNADEVAKAAGMM